MQYTFTTFHKKQLTCCSDGNLYNDDSHNGTGESDLYFTVEEASDGKCYIKTKYGYVSTANEKITCNGSKSDEGALWKCTTVRDGVLAFEGAYGKWFSCEPQGGVVCNGPKQDTWEELTIVEKKEEEKPKTETTQETTQETKQDETKPDKHGDKPPMPIDPALVSKCCLMI